MEDPEDKKEGLITSIKNTLLLPLRAAISKPALRAYLTTFLVGSTAIVLLGCAVSAYTLFYWSYMPRIGFERTAHLQFINVYTPSDSRDGVAQPASPYPYGTVSLTPDIASAQGYDVLVELSLPRTPENRNTGNFMLEVTLHAPHEKSSKLKDQVTEGLRSMATTSEPVLARSRRPAIMTYQSAIVELINKLTELPWYLLGWRREAELVKVSMFEGVEFAKGWRNVPATLKLEVQSTHRMQIYSAKVAFRARFRGLRWLMYNYRVLSSVIFIGVFWSTEMLFAGLAWAALTVFVFPPQRDIKQEDTEEDSSVIKKDDEAKQTDLSDTERIFPTQTGRQQLRYLSPAIKKEEEDEKTAMLPELTPTAAEADDEDEDADFFDSGLGTSMESSAAMRINSVKRRRSRMSAGDRP